MSRSPILPLFAPRLAGEFLLGVSGDEARWFRVINITSFGVEDREITFRLSEDENAISYIAGRTPDADRAQRELFELMLTLDASTDASTKQGEET